MPLFLQIYPHLFHFTYKVDPKMPTPKQFTRKLQTFTRALLLTFIMSALSPLLGPPHARADCSGPGGKQSLHNGPPLSQD